MKAELVPDNGDPPIRITRDLTVVGRRGFCDVVVDHPSLSSGIACWSRPTGSWWFRDPGEHERDEGEGAEIRWAALLPEDRLTTWGVTSSGFTLARRRTRAVGAGGAEARRRPKPDPRDDEKAGFPPPSPLETADHEGPAELAGQRR